MRKLFPTVLALLPFAVMAQQNPNCGTTAPCPLPEPESWPLVVLAIGVMAVVRHLNKRR